MMVCKESQGTVTFHTNGENPEWLHSWTETEQALNQGIPVHTTQMDLLDSHWLRDRYAEVVLEDEGRDIVLRSDGNRWQVVATDMMLCGLRSLLTLWQEGTFDEKDMRPTRGQALRRASYLRTRGPMPRIGSEGRRSVTFHMDGFDNKTIHGWLSGCALLEVGMSFSTTQISLLDDWRIKTLYDEVIIASEDGTVTLDDAGDHWKIPSSERYFPKTESLLSLWKSGELAVA